VQHVAAVEYDGGVVSSSRIREAVRAGKVSAAARLLDRPHVVVGAVVHGDARGRELGFPTANLAVLTQLVPERGVYACRVRHGGALVAAVANRGCRPTFDGDEERFEVHLLDFEGDLYGATLRVELVERIREERSFASPGELVAQIEDDVLAARRILS
jgi:riboflavin kinase/FMN adenylyltransferase